MLDIINHEFRRAGVELTGERLDEPVDQFSPILTIATFLRDSAGKLANDDKANLRERLTVLGIPFVAHDSQ
jgi:hypothetical protein